MPTDMELFGGTMMSPVVDPYTVYRRLRREQPVICVEGLLGRDHLVTRYDDVLAILKNPTLFSSRASARGAGLVMGRTILFRSFGKTTSPRTFGHPGAGGQIAWGDPVSGISFGYCLDGFADWTVQGRRTTALSSLAGSCAPS